ncbi:hypothetical protein [Caballeronia sp. INSB1]|uniref:Acb2/Tad1 domain-containing protein n=1 Tax=Caballeronia sp. INSB1 TaxID=2921751 RepID=UPI00203314ED|nr:hypothetical protein [Caballeronia sp. INSB1]
MDNQHRRIAGYRELSQVEIDLMNRIKAHAEETRKLVEAVQAAAVPTLPELNAAHGHAETDLIEGEAVYAGHAGGPWRWICLADDHLQQGYMALTRAVAKPTSYSAGLWRRRDGCKNCEVGGLDGAFGRGLMYGLQAGPPPPFCFAGTARARSFSSHKLFKFG